MLLLDRFDDTQLLFPSPLKRARYKPVLGLYGVILTPSALGLVAGALHAKRPLALELTTLQLQLARRRECDLNLIRHQGIENHPLDQAVNGQGPDFLAQNTALLVPIRPAAIDRVVGIRARVAHAHAPSATAADRNSL